MSFILQAEDIDMAPLSCVRKPLSSIYPDDMKVSSRRCLSETGQAESLPRLPAQVEVQSVVCIQVSDGSAGQGTEKGEVQFTDDSCDHSTEMKRTVSTKYCIGLGRGALV